jgi:hypothetical protein
MTVPNIIEVSPGDQAQGVIIGAPIIILFDSEIDTLSLENGGFVLEGPDNDRIQGPFLGLWDDPDKKLDDDVLTSPGYLGLVQGTWTFERVDANGNSGAYYDYSGGGSDFRHKATFQPDVSLFPTTQYTAFISGDENVGDSIDTGVRSRTVFDTQKGANIGTGEAEFIGGYLGTVSDTYAITITQSGEVGVAEFEWYRNLEPFIIHGPIKTSTKEILLDQGVKVKFFTDGQYEVNDLFNVVVRKGDPILDNYRWSFVTGSGSIKTVPTVQSGSVLPGGAAIISADAPLQVVKITPDLRATNLDPFLEATNTIIVEFNKDIDPATAIADLVKIISEPVNGDVNNENILFTGEMAKTLQVQGKKVIISLS